MTEEENKEEAPAEEEGEKREEVPSIDSALASLSRLLSSLGYTTRKKAVLSIDRSIPAEVDLIAMSKEKIFLTEVEVVPPSEQLGWESVISKYSTILQPTMEKLHAELVSGKGYYSSAKIIPVLVVIGGVPSEGLKKIANERNVRILSLTTDDVQSIAKTTEIDQLREKAKQMFEVT